MENFVDNRVGPEDFEGVALLGKGSFGQVYLVRYIADGQLYALKLLNKDRVFGRSYIESNLVRYAFTERNILSSINHPFMVSLNFAFQTPGKLCLVMDYMAGGDLGTQLSKERKFAEERARFYICEVVLAIEELHRHGIIFRDLKPENVVLDAEGHAHLTDFGLSKEGMYEGQQTRSFCGSIAYLAPEMLRRKGHDKSVDWYLMGVLLYEMLTGSPPYYSANREQLFYNIQRGKLHMPRFISEAARNLIQKLLHRDPKKRLGYLRDGEEIKEHPFFEGVNWAAFLKRELKPPPLYLPKRHKKTISFEDMFGNVDKDEEVGKLSGWSFIEKKQSV